jgi:hypothetical protein
LNLGGFRAFLNPIGREGGYISIASRERTSTVAEFKNPKKSCAVGFRPSQIILYTTHFGA